MYGATAACRASSLQVVGDDGGGGGGARKAEDTHSECCACMLGPTCSLGGAWLLLCVCPSNFLPCQLWTPVVFEGSSSVFMALCSLGRWQIGWRKQFKQAASPGSPQAPLLSTAAALTRGSHATRHMSEGQGHQQQQQESRRHTQASSKMMVVDTLSSQPHSVGPGWAWALIKGER